MPLAHAIILGRRRATAMGCRGIGVPKTWASKLCGGGSRALASIPRFRQQQLRCHIQAIREALQFF